MKENCKVSLKKWVKKNSEPQKNKIYIHLRVLNLQSKCNNHLPPKKDAHK